ncbi:MAG: chromate transporter [Oscillospiraceae bacterium]|nr:chromate transporter [Oscillospiraceae bacterium]
MIFKLLELFLIFFKIGLFTVGGGMAMLPLIQQELVERHMMTLQQSVDMVAISQMTPGPFAINSATFVGMQLYGVPGAAIATLGVVLPSILICLIVAHMLKRFQSSFWVQSTLGGIRPVVMALIAYSFLTISFDSLLPNGFGAAIDVPVLVIAVLSFAFLEMGKVNPVLLILASGIFGALFLRPS